jgi:hypothetical protein
MGRLRQHFPLSELIDNLAARPVDPGLDCAQGATHRRGDILVTHFVLVKQDKRLSVFNSDVQQRPLDLFAQMAGGVAVVRLVGRLLGKGTGGGPATADGNQRPAAVAGDRQQPRHKLARPVPMGQAPQGPNKALLSHVLGVLPMTEHAITEAEDLTLEPIHKLDHGDLLARQTTVN